MEIKKVKIAHLYPDELNLYGDAGNVSCLYNRLIWRGYKVEIAGIGIGDKITDFDIMFIGGGQDREMNIISRDLKRKAEMIAYSVESGKTVLAICGGFQILGQYYRAADGNELNLTGALPFYTIGSSQRMIGNIVTQTKYGRLVGFENHSGKTYLSDGLSPLGTVVTGFGNNAKDKTEGVEYKNTFATYLHGPLLPKNPAFADEILSRALNEKLDCLDDYYENQCHRLLIERFT